jgi:hypothetical protein
MHPTLWINLAVRVFTLRSLLQIGSLLVGLCFCFGFIGALFTETTRSMRRRGKRLPTSMREWIVTTVRFVIRELRLVKQESSVDSAPFRTRNDWSVIVPVGVIIVILAALTWASTRGH